MDQGSKARAAVYRGAEQLSAAIREERTAVIAIDRPELAAEAVRLIKAGEEIRPEHIRAVVDAAEVALGNAPIAQLQWDANMRAIERWQAGDALPAEGRVMLEKAAKRFREYEDHHRTKSWASDTSKGGIRPSEREAHERTMKAESNAAMAAEIEALLAKAAPGGRPLLWPDHADLLVWILEQNEALMRVAPEGISLDEVAKLIGDLEQEAAADLRPPSAPHARAARMLQALAEALIAFEVRAFQAASDADLIAPLIVAWLRSQGTAESRVAAYARVFARQIEAGEWLPLRGAAIRAQRKCRICGCTEANACVWREAGGVGADRHCAWVEYDLCDAPACLKAAELARAGGSAPDDLRAAIVVKELLAQEPCPEPKAGETEDDFARVVGRWAARLAMRAFQAGAGVPEEVQEQRLRRYGPGVAPIPVRSPIAGEVSSIAFSNENGGYSIDIKAGEAVHRFGFLSSLECGEGEGVEPGDIIGYTGGPLEESNLTGCLDPEAHKGACGFSRRHEAGDMGEGSRAQGLAGGAPGAAEGPCGHYPAGPLPEEKRLGPGYAPDAGGRPVYDGPEDPEKSG